MAINMTDEEVIDHLKQWLNIHTGKTPLFKFPTMACGYEQNMKFMRFINQHYDGGISEELSMVDVVMDYIHLLSKGK